MRRRTAWHAGLKLTRRYVYTYARRHVFDRTTISLTLVAVTSIREVAQ